MKKFLSLILTLLLIGTMFSGTFTANAEVTSGFETDFKEYTNTSSFKKIYDANGQEVVGKFTFSKTDEGLRYKREADEIFYNPSGGDRTHLGGHKSFPVCKTGKSDSSVFQVSANTYYKVELNYNCTVLGDGAQIALTAAFSQANGNADVATNGKSAAIPMTVSPTDTTSAVINKTGSGTITGYFTTKEIVVVNSSSYDRLFLQLNSTDKKDVEITLTNLKISPLSKITVHDVISGNDTYYYGEAGTAFSLKDVPTDEKYLIGSKVNYTKQASILHADENLSAVASNTVFPVSGNTTYYTANENVTTENQVAFCGFDQYTLRKEIKNPSNLSIGFKTVNEALPGGTQISDETAYTGSKSLKIVTDAASEKVIYVGSGYELQNNATYRLSLRYRVADVNNTSDIMLGFTSGNGADSISATESCKITKDELNSGTTWKSLILYYTPDIKDENATLYLAPVLKVTTDAAAEIYIDSCVISKVVSAEGTSILKEESSNQALRFYFSYDINGDGVMVDSKKLSVAKRGILFADADKIDSLSLLTVDNSQISKVETSDFDSCWAYDNDSEKITFSAYLKNVTEKYFDKKLAVRGYVVLSDGTVFYSEIINESVNTVKEKNSKTDMFYELIDVNDTEYKNIHIYIPTSDPSGKYYIRYNLYYTYSEQPDDMTVANKANTGYNQETYRIKGAVLTEKTDDSFKVKTTGVLHEGELELAIRESRSGVNDFIGGYHGDEIMKYARLYVDGKEISINSENSGLTPCKNITFETDTTMYRCASGTADNPKGTAVCEHYLNYKINSQNGIVIDQKVTWLVDDFKNDVPMVCMFTIGRYSGNEKITDTIEYYKWDGSYIDTIDATSYGPGKEGFGYSSYSGPAYAVAYSKDSGFVATVGYKNIRGLQGAYKNYIWIRPYNDNKAYFQTNTGRTNQIGEVWEWTNYFNFDYVTPEK